MAVFLQQTSKCVKCKKSFKHFGVGEPGIHLLVDWLLIPLCKKCGNEVRIFIYGKMEKK